MTENQIKFKVFCDTLGLSYDEVTCKYLKGYNGLEPWFYYGNIEGAVFDDTGYYNETYEYLYDRILYDWDIFDDLVFDDIDAENIINETLSSNSYDIINIALADRDFNNDFKVDWLLKNNYIDSYDIESNDDFNPYVVMVDILYDEYKDNILGFFKELGEYSEKYEKLSLRDLCKYIGYYSKPLNNKFMSLLKKLVVYTIETYGMDDVWRNYSYRPITTEYNGKVYHILRWKK